jgi:hypothetical protein
MAKEKNKAKSQRDPLPEHFASLEAAAEFWDTHDSADYEDYMQDVDCAAQIKRRTYMISLDSELYRKLRVIAKQRGVQAETLVNLWLQEKTS